MMPVYNILIIFTFYSNLEENTQNKCDVLSANQVTILTEITTASACTAFHAAIFVDQVNIMLSVRARVI